MCGGYQIAFGSFHKSIPASPNLYEKKKLSCDTQKDISSILIKTISVFIQHLKRCCFD